jgi:hypothetical protein
MRGTEREDEQDPEFIIVRVMENPEYCIRSSIVEKDNGDEIRDHEVVDHCEPDERTRFPSGDH